MSKGNLRISTPVFGDGREVVQIELECTSSVTKCMTIEMSYHEFAKCLTGSMGGTCEFTLPNNRDIAGKVRETMSISAKMPESYDYSERKQVAAEVCEKVTPEGWVIEKYFGSQSSFTRGENNSEWANTRAIRYVEQSAE